MNCKSLNNLTIPACGITEIEGGAFYGCSNLTIDCRINSYPKITLSSKYNYGNQYPFNGIKKLRVMPWLISKYLSGTYTKEILYDEVLTTPKYEEQTTKGVTESGGILCYNCKVYKISITRGIIYSF